MGGGGTAACPTGRLPGGRQQVFNTSPLSPSPHLLTTLATVPSHSPPLPQVARRGLGLGAYGLVEQAAAKATRLGSASSSAAAALCPLPLEQVEEFELWQKEWVRAVHARWGGGGGQAGARVAKLLCCLLLRLPLSCTC